MKNKRILFISFTLVAVLVVGPMAFSIGAAEGNGGMGNMMNGMMNGNGMNGMMNMMENGNMSKMMENMNTSEGQEMMNACSNFMSSYGETK